MKEKKATITAKGASIKQWADIILELNLMKKIFLILSLLAFTSCMAIGPKCTYTQEGTRIESWLWLFKGGKPADVDKMNCN